MKHVVSISIGSSRRNHRVSLDINNEEIIVERIGTDGDIQMAIKLIRELDGKVDAFGMGGIDAYLSAGNACYRIRDAVPILEAAKITPMVDGSGLKMSLEKNVPGFINENVESIKGRSVFMMPAIDRYGMAEGFKTWAASLCLEILWLRLVLTYR